MVESDVGVDGVWGSCEVSRCVIASTHVPDDVAWCCSDQCSSVNFECSCRDAIAVWMAVL